MPKKDKTTETTWIDPDDAPPWSQEAFDRAEIRDGDRLVREATGTLTKRGRPPIENPKQLVSLRLDQDLLERLRASGPGWQSRVNEILKKAVPA